VSVSLRKQVAAARKTNDKITQAIFACAPDNNTVFSECLKMASDELREKHYAIQSRIIELECEAVSKGKAWRGAFGMLVWNR
jgi:hypothetical protein